MENKEQYISEFGLEGLNIIAKTLENYCNQDVIHTHIHTIGLTNDVILTTVLLGSIYLLGVYIQTIGKSKNV